MVQKCTLGQVTFESGLFFVELINDKHFDRYYHYGNSINMLFCEILYYIYFYKLYLSIRLSLDIIIKNGQVQSEKYNNLKTCHPLIIILYFLPNITLPTWCRSP